MPPDFRVIICDGNGLIFPARETRFKYDHIFSHPNADVLIAQKTIESASVQDIVLVGDDKDLFVLLLYHSNPTGKGLFFAPEPKKNAKQQVWDLKQAKRDIGPFVCKHILFLHALLGCDTTSRLFGIGKAIY